VLTDNSLLTFKKTVMPSSSGSVSPVVLGKIQSSVSQTCVIHGASVLSALSSERYAYDIMFLSPLKAFRQQIMLIKSVMKMTTVMATES
jgi:hypothetical protein